MKILNWFFILLFIFSAALQYNDPDPYIWVPIYLYAAWLCWQSIKGKYNKWWYIAGLVVYTGYAIGLVFDVDGVISWITRHHSETIVGSMKATKPWIEETRECGGLIICDIALIVNMIYLGRKNKTSAN